jgi:alkyl hydroperoxide reductase 1
MSGTLKVGDALPSDITFSYIPYTPENSDITSCGIPINYSASKGKFTPFFLSPRLLI